MKRDFEDHCWKDIVNDEILEIYGAYKRETFVGPRPAILAIDLYNKAYKGGNRPVIEVNREETPLSSLATRTYRGPAGEILPKLTAELETWAREGRWPSPS